MTSEPKASEPETTDMEEPEDLWDLLPDHVAVDMVLKKLDVVPFHPRFVLQCLESGWWPWSNRTDGRLGTLMRLKVPMSAPGGYIARLRQLVAENVRSLTGVETSFPPRWTLNDVALFRGVQELTLNLQRPLAPGPLTEALEPLLGLTALTVRALCPNSAPLDLAPFASLRRLRTLHLVTGTSALDTGGMEAMFRGLAMCLRDFTLSSTCPAPPEPILSHLSALSALTSLHLCDILFTEDGTDPVSFVTSLTQLRTLHITPHFSRRRTSCSADTLAKLPLLEHVVLEGCPIMSGGANSLAPLNQLTAFEVGGPGTVLLSDDLVRVMIRPLASQLVSLRLDYFLITNVCAQSVGALTRLTRLTIGIVPCNYVPHLAPLTALRDLSIRIENTTLSAVGALSSLTALESLAIHAGYEERLIPHGDEFLSRISLQFTRLTKLCLGEFAGATSDAGLHHLTRLSRLQKLIFLESEEPIRRTHAEGIRYFRACRPQCVVCVADGAFHLREGDTAVNIDILDGLWTNVFHTDRSP